MRYKALCVDDHGCELLTKGRVYTVHWEKNDSWVMVPGINDDGALVLGGYYPWRFEILEDYKPNLDNWS